MKRIRITCILAVFVAIAMISTGTFIQNQEGKKKNVKIESTSQNIKNMAANANMIVKEVEEKQQEEEIPPTFEEVEMEIAPSSIIVPPRVEVYEGMTLAELSEKLNRNLGNDIIAGKGEIIASECINKGVDPYITVAIILHETGCGTNCSNLARNCYNFGGQKGSPSCNGGAFKQYDSIEEGLVGMIDNLSKNYFSIGLNTPETIGPKYCEGNEWAGKISWFVNKIRNS